MKKPIIAAVLLVLGAMSVLAGDEVKMPFPQAVTYKYGITPSNISQEQMNNDVISFYEYWKEKYLKPTDMPGGYYVEGETTNLKVPAKGCSEGQGYGMIATVLMAGHDPKAKEYFDGLYKFFDAHRSILNPELMGWTVANDERDSTFDSATDGDMDIAYAMLLAHKQWGSNGEINYLQEAKDMITLGLKASCIDSATKRIVLGDWDSTATATRSSDWMTAQIEAYRIATEDSFWNVVNDSIYYIMGEFNAKYSVGTGLMPDFVTGVPPRPVNDDFLERDTDNDYSWNACRFPWRIASHYIHYGDERAKETMNILVNWAKKSCNGDPSKFTSVYKLDGTPLETYTSTAFTSPVLVAAMVDPAHQDFLNKGWDYMKNNKYKYFNDTINLLCMLQISGNWWVYQ